MGQHLGFNHLLQLSESDYCNIVINSDTITLIIAGWNMMFKEPNIGMLHQHIIGNYPSEHHLLAD